jgi:16S rRNA (cytidine1402-2'-O)-methyltransferase
MDTPENSPPHTGPSNDQSPAPPPSKPKGKLIMAATCLGHMDDIPRRSLDLLRNAGDKDLLVFEEDKLARKFLKAAGVHKPYARFSEHGQSETLSSVSKTLKKGGTVVYMSDQGTPGLGDPGRDLVQRALDIGAEMSTIPGPSSITAAISLCPFDCRQFTYLGFLPRQAIKRTEVLKKAAQYEHPVIILDAPYRILQLLEATSRSFGPSRRAFLARDISGPLEAFWVGPLSKLRMESERLWEEEKEKVNFVLIVDGR